MGLHGDVFPSWDLYLSSLVLMGVFLIHLAVQVQAISCTTLSQSSGITACWITTWESDPPHGIQILQSGIKVADSKAGTISD